MTETLAAADLLPGDVIATTGEQVIGYPRAGVFGRTAVPLLRKNVEITRHVESETPFQVHRY